MLATLPASFALLGLFLLLRRVSAALGHHPLANPVMWSAILVWAALALVGIGEARFAAATGPLAVLLEVAIVALALPLVTALMEAPRPRLALLAALLAGSLVAMASAVGLALLFGLADPLVQAFSVKSVSSGFAIALMDRFGGPASLAAGIVVTTGIFGAIVLPPLLARLGFDARARGLGTGQAAHVVGTDTLLAREPEAGRYAALAMAAAGLIGALLLPFLWPFIA